MTVIGNSIGGWIAAEIALLNSPQVSGVILVDAAGLKIDAHPSADFFSLTMDQVAELSYYQPGRVPHRPGQPASRGEGGDGRQPGRPGTSTAGRRWPTPACSASLPRGRVPVLVVWGAADRMIPVERGEAYAAAIPGAQSA